MSQAKLELLSSIDHAKIKVKTTSYDEPCFQKNASRVVVSELKTLIHEYPIFIVKSSETGEFQLTALLGFETRENLFIHKGQWRAKYQPLDMLRHPFQLYVEEKTSDQGGRIVIDLNNGLVGEHNGESLFNQDASPSDYLIRVRQTFAALMKGKEDTDKITNIMQQHDLLESVSIELEIKGQKQTINDLYTINIKSLNALSGAALEECHTTGVLEVCHLMMSSGAHLEKMVQWANA